ncbi:hypothetical protein [Candidatus Nitrospira nitrificans]|uniref:hypothetical protein n=1 Tax=Candidatus Nitrospira nitrificans TaxID=1742973 RepID=UPI001111FB13|nr:hypothetical protein [Candidatus Nitrospira nitrificans]
MATMFEHENIRILAIKLALVPSMEIRFAIFAPIKPQIKDGLEPSLVIVLKSIKFNSSRYFFIIWKYEERQTSPTVRLRIAMKF